MSSTACIKWIKISSPSFKPTLIVGLLLTSSQVDCTNSCIASLIFLALDLVIGPSATCKGSLRLNPPCFPSLPSLKAHSSTIKLEHFPKDLAKPPSQFLSLFLKSPPPSAHPKEELVTMSLLSLTHPTFGLLHLIGIEVREGLVRRLETNATNSVPFPIHENKNLWSITPLSKIN